MKIKQEYQPFVPYKLAQDCIRIMEILNKNSVVCSYYEAYIAWDNYSDSLCASWIILPESDEEIFNILVEQEE